MIYTIKQGNHYSLPITNLPTFSNIFEATWVFNDSIKQEFEDHQWNKLCGVWFLPPVSKLWEFKTKLPRYNSVMIAFRYKEGQLELSPYLHRNGSADRYESNLNGVNLNVKEDCTINEPIYTKIKFTDTTVTITINNNISEFKFKKRKLGFTIKPWFGGQKPSKNLLTIKKL